PQHGSASPVQASDRVRSGMPGAAVTSATVLRNGTVVEFTITGITGEGTLTASIAAGAISDTFGNPGAAFSASYGADIVTANYPVPLVAQAPAGSLIYDPTVTGVVNFAGDTDSYLVNLD